MVNVDIWLNIVSLVNQRGSKKQEKIHVINDSDGACPTKEVHIGKLITQAVVDSGASVSCISYRLLCDAFPHGFYLEQTCINLTGPSSESLPTKGVVKTRVRFDEYNVPCTLHALDADNEVFLLGWDIMCQFDKITLKPKENSIDFGETLLQTSECVSAVRVQRNILIPPRSQRVLRVSVDKPSNGSLLIERSSEFEEKSGLFLGRTVSSSLNPHVSIMNPETSSKMLYKSQAVGLATEVNTIDKLQASSVNTVSDSVSDSWNIGPISKERKSELLGLLSKFQDSVFTGIGRAIDHKYDLRLNDNADLSKVRSRRFRSNPKMKAEIETQVKSMLQSDIIERSNTHVISSIVH